VLGRNYIKTILFSYFLVSYVTVCVAQYNNDFNVTPNSGSLNSIDHTFTGFTKKLSNGRLIHLFRLDPGDNGNHVGNMGGIAQRFSDDNGLTWSMPEIIYKDEYDDRIGSGGILDNGEIVVFFGRYQCTSIWGGYYIDMNFISSSDNGASWSSRNFIENVDKSALMYDIFKIPGESGYFASSYGGYYADIRHSDDGHNWDSVYHAWDYRSTQELYIGEQIFATIGNGKIIGLFRVDKVGIYQTVSGDNGRTWSKLEPTNLANGYACSLPYQVYDEKLNKIYTIVCDRRGTDYDLNNFNSGIWIYCNDPEVLFNDAKGYSNCRFVPRGNPNLFRFLGYPYAAKTNDSTYVVLYSDCYKKPNNLEEADFFQFSINISKDVYILKLDQSISVNPIQELPYDMNNFEIGALSSSSLPISYTSSNESIIKIINGKIQPIGIGTANITIQQNGDNIYKPATPITFPVTIKKANQTIDFHPPPTVKYGDPDIFISANVSSSLPYFLHSSDTSVAKIELGKVKIVGCGKCFITIEQSGNEFYNPATSIAQTLIVEKQDQNIDFFLPSKVFANQPNIDLKEHSSSNLPVEIISSDTTIAKYVNGKLNIIGSGTCIITAQQFGNGIFNAANSVHKTLIIEKINQTVDFFLPQVVYPNQIPIDLNAFSSSYLPVELTSSDTTIAKFLYGKLTIQSAGTCIITAKQLGNSIYNESSINKTFKVEKLSQYVNISLPSTITMGQQDIYINAYASSFLPIDISSSDTTVAKFIDGKLSIIGAGICNITVGQIGNEIYNAAIPISKPLKVDKQNQYVDFYLPSTITMDQTSINLYAYANSYLPVEISSTDTTIAKYENGQLLIVGSGYCVITAKQDGNSIYNAALAISKTIKVEKLTQTLDFVLPASVTMLQNEIDIKAHASSNLQIEVISSDTTIAQFNNGKLNLKAAGICLITVLQKGNEKYLSALSISKTLKIDKVSQTIDFVLPLTATMLQNTIDIKAQASSNLPIDIISSDTSKAIFENGLLRIKGAGICSITAKQDGNYIYNSIVSKTKSFTIEKINQTVTAIIPSSLYVGDSNITINALASSLLPIDISLSDTTVIINRHGVLTAIGSGVCLVTINQAGNGIYNASNTISKIISVFKRDQTINTITQQTAIFGDQNIKLDNNASSGLTVTYSSSNDSIATIINGELQIRNVGFCTIMAKQDGNYMFNPALTNNILFEVKKANQKIDFNPIQTAKYLDTDINLDATSSSGLSLSYETSDSSIAQIINNKIHINGVGTCIIYAYQKGNQSYNSAQTVSQIFEVTKADQVISFNPSQSFIYGDEDYILNANASSGLAVEFTSSDTNIVKIKNNILTIVGTGNCSLLANQKGNNLFNQAAEISVNVNIEKAIQTLTLKTIPTLQFNDTLIDPLMDITSGLALTFHSSDTSIVKIEDQKIRIVGVGSCIISAIQTGNSLYNPSNKVEVAIQIAKAYQKIDFEPINLVYENDSIIELVEHTNSGLRIQYSSSDTSVAVIVGHYVLIKRQGITFIKAVQIGDDNYHAAQQVTQILKVLKDTTSSYTNTIQSIIYPYPNPAKNTITINGTQNSTLLIFDLKGRLLHQSFEVTNQATIDISNFVSGMYIIKIINSDKNYSFIFNKE